MADVISGSLLADTSLYQACSFSLAVSLVSFLFLKTARSLHTREYASFSFGANSNTMLALTFWLSLQFSPLCGRILLTRVNSSTLVSPLDSSFGTNFSLARSLGLPRFSPGFFGCALRYLALAFLRAFFYLLNSFFSLLCSAMAFRLKRMRIASSPSNWSSSHGNSQSRCLRSGLVSRRNFRRAAFISKL